MVQRNVVDAGWSSRVGGVWIDRAQGLTTQCECNYDGRKPEVWEFAMNRERIKIEMLRRACFQHSLTILAARSGTWTQLLSLLSLSLSLLGQCARDGICMFLTLRDRR